MDLRVKERSCPKLLRIPFSPLQFDDHLGRLGDKLVERRDSQRVSCQNLSSSQVFCGPEQHPITVDVVNMSARGWCGFYLGENPLESGEVLYLFRKGLKRVYYEVCWCREVSEQAYRVGVKILESGEGCVRLPLDVLSLCRGRYAKRKKRQVGITPLVT